MPIKDDLRTAGVNPDSLSDVLGYVARIPVLRSERMRLLRQYEQETLNTFDPGAFARAVDGIPPT